MPALSPLARRRIVVVVVAGILAVLLAYVLSVPLAGNRPVQTISGSRLVGRPAPAFELVDLEGRTIRLADYLGRPVVVNFWASWCEPCKEEFPLFDAAREAHAGEGLEILGLIHDDGPEAARAFAASRGAEWPLLLDPDDVAYRAYEVLFLPETFYVDRSGIVRAVSFGPPPSGVLDDQLAKILGP